ncbi:MAG: M23 family metallopeptidase [Paracoccaceae bacterium]
MIDGSAARWYSEGIDRWVQDEDAMPGRTIIAFAIAVALSGDSFAVMRPVPIATVYPDHAYPIVSQFGSWIGLAGLTRDTPNNGVDIIARVRTPVHAAEHGRVRRVLIDAKRGKVVEIVTTQTDQPYTLFYTHLHATEVEAGEHVKAGEIIGSVGDTGLVPRGIAYLHFGVFAPDSHTLLDPEPFLRSRPTGAIECVDPEIVGNDPGDGGYGLERFKRIRDGAQDGAPFLYPVACTKRK